MSQQLLTAVCGFACLPLVLGKLLIGTVLAIFVGKLVFPKQFKGLGAQLDRLVNATIIAILVVFLIRAVIECRG